VLAAVTAAESTGMRSFAGLDDADIAAARFLAIDGTIELHPEAGEAIGFSGIEHVDLVHGT
jgi:hypothetical protein